MGSDQRYDDNEDTSASMPENGADVDGRGPGENVPARKPSGSLRGSDGPPGGPGPPSWLALSGLTLTNACAVVVVLLGVAAVLGAAALLMNTIDPGVLATIVAAATGAGAGSVWHGRRDRDRHSEGMPDGQDGESRTDRPRPRQR